MEGLFFPKNERNDQERSHRSEKNERLEHVLKILERLVKERNGNCLKIKFKIVNAFLLSRTCSKLGTHFKSRKSHKIIQCSAQKLSKLILLTLNLKQII